MKPIRREVLNGLFVLVLSTLLSASFAAFQIKFDIRLWVLILMSSAIAVAAYVVFEYVLSAEDRENEWLKRVGTPARLVYGQDVGQGVFVGFTDAINALTPSSDYTAVSYCRSETPLATEERDEAGRGASRAYGLLLERLRQGRMHEYKRIICFDHDVLANDQELRSGTVRVGEGPGTIDRVMGEHCRLMMKTKACSLYVAPAVVPFTVVLLGVDKVALVVDTAGPTGRRAAAGAIFFCDPPNGEIVEQFRQFGARDRTTHGCSPQDSVPRRCTAKGRGGKRLRRYPIKG